MADPNQLENLMTRADKDFIKCLSTRLTKFKACDGEDYRKLEDMPTTQ